MSLLLAMMAAVPLSWQGTAVVHDGSRSIAITVRSRVEESGRVVSESWPTSMGEEEGLRHLVIEPDGQGFVDRGGTRQSADAAFVREEVAQFGFYQQLQAAVAWCDRQPLRAEAVRLVDGPAATNFRCIRRRITNAANHVAAAGKPVRQDFRIMGLHRSGNAVFPRHMRISRDGRPFFDLTVTRFRSP